MALMSTTEHNVCCRIQQPLLNKAGGLLWDMSPPGPQAQGPAHPMQIYILSYFLQHFQHSISAMLLQYIK